MQSQERYAQRYGCGISSVHEKEKRGGSATRQARRQSNGEKANRRRTPSDCQKCSSGALGNSVQKGERMKLILVAFFFSILLHAQDATELEARYKTCAKHSIPSDKCTPEIYQQLKAKDDAPLDPNTAAALKAAKEYRKRLKNPESMQVQTAYVTERGDICLEIGGQNTLGGMSVSRIVYTSKGRWMDEGGFLGGMARDQSGSYTVDRWGGYCTKPPTPFHPNQKLLPGIDVTGNVNRALKQ
jgi:hypothetical protein